MTRNATLKLEVTSYWHAGTGRGAGATLDALTCRTSDDLPFLPGKTLKGLVRDAVHRWETFTGAEQHAGATEPVTDQLFGPRGVEGVTTYRGLLRFSNAQLPSDVAGYLALRSNEGLRRRLYAKHLSTAIDPASGTALDKSLRGMEVAIPMTLEAHIEEVEDAQFTGLSDAWIDILRRALPLVRAVGSYRSRGLGRCVISVEEVSE